MNTTIRINATELPDLIAVLKTLLKKEKVIEITVKPVREISAQQEETREEYFSKLNKRFKNIDEGKNLISFTEEEFKQLVAERTEKYGKKG